MKKHALEVKLKKYVQELGLRLGRGEILQSSIVIAYYVLFGFFPLLMIFGNLLPFFHIDSRPIAKYLSLILPTELSDLVMPIIRSLLYQRSTGFLSFGVVIAVWSFSCLINAVRIGMNRLYGVHQTELRLPMSNFLWTRTITVALTGLLIAVLFVFIFVLTFGNDIVDFLAPIFHFSLRGYETLRSYRWPALGALLFVTDFFLNWLLPNIKVKKRTLWPGVIVTVVGWVLLSYGFRLYLHNFNLSWYSYGVVGTFIIFMLWLNVSAIVFLFGTAINAAADRVKYKRIGYSAGRLAEKWRQTHASRQNGK